ncbi:MAG TPA: nitroreductase family protein [Nitrospiraceae bacterium]|nr:nitroreductase family protein [Nitrospiraceae bacterium]
MELLEGIYTRRSVRHYTDQPVTKHQLMEIIKAGTWAPSGLNNQPWRFVIVKNKTMLFDLAQLTTYRHIIEKAQACIAVFADTKAMYHDVKDHQAIGACIQNMLLAAHALGLGAVWLGEILKNAGEVRALLELPEEMDLMAVLAVGHPTDKSTKSSSRKKISEVLLRTI